MQQFILKFLVIKCGPEVFHEQNIRRFISDRKEREYLNNTNKLSHYI